MLILWGLTIGMAVIALYAFLRWRELSQQIRSISEQLERIHSESRANRVLESSDQKEVQRLTVCINRVLDDYQNLNVSQIKTQKSMQCMLSNVSHDLKTPLSVIAGYIELLKLGKVSSEIERTKIYGKLADKITDLQALMTAFFHMNKLESGDTTLDLKRLDVCELVRQSALAYYETLIAMGFEVVLNIPEKPCYIMGCTDAIGRILDNLISNALRYGATGKFLGIAVEPDFSAGTVAIIVSDKGKGIEPAYQEQVFERLFTLEDSRNRAYQGSGLGLAITKQLTSLLGGNIALNSRPFELTQFTVILPLGIQETC